MDVLNHLFAALGRLLLGVSTVLMIEELTLGGLARLLLSMRFACRSRRRRTMRDRAMAGSTGGCFEVSNKKAQGGKSCSQSNMH